MVSAFIAERANEKSPANAATRELKNLAIWDARLAYFLAHSPDLTPEFEMGVRYRENGVVEELIQDYGAYTIVARLDQLELFLPGSARFAGDLPSNARPLLIAGVPNFPDVCHCRSILRTSPVYHQAGCFDLRRRVQQGEPHRHR